MLKLNQIVKHYDTGLNQVHALKGISIQFRAAEFVAILGQSGCGKTTLLNIIGGLDRYTSGDLVIRGKSTKKYKPRDWDTYRNHSVGFVFQSYNLIPHQSVLQNVELALTLSGVKKKERRRRAIDALVKVGLEDQLHKKPNQMSGGQMQRVAIARALVNDPEILLADEPTGALDSETSVQVMDILKEISKDRLVIMVTHNPELAQTYATRIVRLLDGQLVSDSNPYDITGLDLPEPRIKKGRQASMSALTAFSLSLSNLMSKKGRTILTAFAGSIGIIGIALILSISTGINDYIAAVEQDTLSSYPVTLQSQTMDMSSMMAAMGPQQSQTTAHEGQIQSMNVMSSMMEMMFSSTTENDLQGFMHYIESGNSGLESLTSEIRYVYSTPLNIYRSDTTDGIHQVNPSTVFSELMGDHAAPPMAAMNNSDVWTQLTDNQPLLQAQYQVLDGRFPEKWNEVVLILDENNRITDYTLYCLGILDTEELRKSMQSAASGGKFELDTSVQNYSYDDFLGMTFKLLPTTDYYEEKNGIWMDRSQDEAYMAAKLENADEVTVVGILKPQPDSSAGSAYGVIGYTGDLMTRLINAVNRSEVVKAQKNTPDTDVLTGLPFRDPDAEPQMYTMDEILEMIPSMEPIKQAALNAGIAQMRQAGMDDQAIAQIISRQLAQNVSSSTYEENLDILGVADLDDPSAINLYPIDFEAKDAISDIIASYNKGKAEAEQITYTDYVGLMMSSVTTIINAISYILIAFVAISLVVSSIMIGIITNISVLERIKEIGILRAVGASKADVSRVFNAETMIEGLAAGLVGIGATELLLVPINQLIESIAGISAKAYLDPTAAVILVIISVCLTFIAGLIPARSAARKDPVVALRTE